VAFVRGYIEGLRSTDGILSDLRAFGTAIAFDRITVPVELWHGTEDQAIPIGASRALAAHLPNATLHECSGEGHFVLLTHAEDVCRAIAGTGRPEAAQGRR
jgi:pimeloyl-ACP methyl ester carboxylesterase